MYHRCMSLPEPTQEDLDAFGDLDETNMEIEAWEIEEVRLIAEGMSADDRIALWESLGKISE